MILTRNGAKLLDFGLAKPRQDMPALVASASTTEPLTGRGSMAGTLPYMAPEQLEGQEANTQSDIFSFGAVLYEMLSGRKAFEGRSSASVVAKILESEPPLLSTIVPQLPRAVEFLIRSCLAKSPQARLQSIQDALIGLDWIQQASSAAAPARAGASPRITWLVVAAALVLTILAGLIVMRPEPSQGPGLRARFDIALPEGLPIDWPDLAGHIPPDGRLLAFTARLEGRRQLWVRRPGGETAALPGTEGAAFAFWSPDSRTIGFFAGGRLKAVDATGGPVRVVTEAYSVSRGAWSADGTIAFVPRQNSPIHVVLEKGGQSRAITALDQSRHETSHRAVRFLPDSRHLLYAASGTPDGIYVASLDGGPVKEVLPGVTAATFVQPGYLLFNRQDALMAQRFDPVTLQLSGAPAPLAGEILGGAFSASDDGTLIYQPGNAGVELEWVTRAGHGTPASTTSAYYQQLSLSPSGRRAAVQRIDTATGNPDIWVIDLDTGIRRD